MNINGPIIKSTMCSPDLREWVPSTADNLLKELEYITETNTKDDFLTLYRGQTDSSWLLDSTFLRAGVTELFGLTSYQKLPNSIRHQVSFHRAVASLMLLKFGSIYKPSKEAFSKEQTYNIDPWFELLKHAQQYPEKYQEVKFIDGTFFIDFTFSQEIALYFSVFDGKEKQRSISSKDGAIWVYDASSTGNILQEDKLEKVLRLMTEGDFLNGQNTNPLMFYPEKHTNQIRANNQAPFYIAQMDFR
jgi:hypothetical protein